MRQESTEDLIKKHEGLIYATLNELNCPRSHEAISQSYEALWRAVETFDESKGNEFSTYACTCIKNAVYDYYRRIKRLNEHEVLLEDYLDEATYIAPTQVVKTDYSVFRCKIAVALSKIKSKKKQQVVQLWIQSDLKTTDIAKQAGCSQSYVSQTLAEFRASVRKEYGDVRSRDDILGYKQDSC